MFRKKGYRSLHSPNSEHGREEEYCFLESQNAKEHDSEPFFFNFLVTIPECYLSHRKARRSWGRALRSNIAQKAFALAHFPKQKTGTNLFNHGGFFLEKLKFKSICLFKGILSTFPDLIYIDFEDSYRRNFGVEYQCVSTI